MKIIYSDHDILVAEKPVGTLSQEGIGEKGMPELLKEAVGGEVFCVHRLDRETGGLMVFARNRESAAALSRSIAERKFEKNYLAVVSGEMEEDEGSLEDLLFYDRKSGKVFPVKRERKGVKRALLTYRITEKTEKLSLAKVTPLTGRTHQIRVQFATRHHPLYGDRKYGGAGECLGLFSHSLSFTHPKSGEPLFFSVLPEKAMPWSLFPSLFETNP